MTVSPSLSSKAERHAEKLGLAYDHFLGARFAANVLVAATVVWFTLRAIGDSNPIWAIASMIAAAEPEPEEARRLFRSRLINVLVGCGVGFVFLIAGGSRQIIIPVALAFTVLISTYFVRVKTMWRQAPITACIVIASGLAAGSPKIGIEHGLHKVAEVLFGCVAGVLVSWATSKVWLVRRPERRTRAGQPPQVPAVD